MRTVKKIVSSFSPLQKLFASGGVTFLFRIGGMALNFLVTFIISKLYGETVYGNYALAFTICQATAIIFALGMPNALISHLTQKDPAHPFSQYMLRKGFTILAGVSILPFLVYYIGADAIAAYIFTNPSLAVYIQIAALVVPAMILHEFILYFFIATGNFLKFNLFMFIVPTLIFISLLFTMQGSSGHYTLAFYLISIFLVLMIEFFMALKPYNKSANDEKPSIRNLVTFSYPMMFSSIMLYMLNMTDIFMLGGMATEEDVAHYSIAYKFASLSMLVIISMNVVLAPKVAQLYKAGDLAALHKTVKKTTHLIIALTLPAVVLLMLLSGFVLSFYGEGYMQGQTVLLILAGGYFLNATSGNVDQILNMTGNQKVLQYLTISGFILNVILNAVLIPHYGINGAAVASLITNVLFNYSCVMIIKKRLGFYTFI